MEEMRGRICWYDLMTPNVEAAKAFYTELIGWEIEVWEGSDSPYAMWKGPGGALGGVMTLPEEAKKMGAPPHWMAYVATPDIEATSKTARELGGKILVPPIEIPAVGRFSVVRDPQDAVFAMFEGTTEVPGHDDDRSVGEISWHELATTDYLAAFGFYEKLFGWKKTESMDMGETGGTYQMFGRKGKTLGGMFTKTEQMPGPPGWLLYIGVEDVKAAVEKAKELEAKLLNGPMKVPGGDMVAQLMDPQGAAFALHAKKKEG